MQFKKHLSAGKTKRCQLSVRSWAPARRPSAHSAKAVTGCEWPGTNGLKFLQLPVFPTKNKASWWSWFMMYSMYFGRAFGCKSFWSSLNYPQKLGRNWAPKPYKIHRTVESMGSSSFTSWPRRNGAPFLPTWRVWNLWNLPCSHDVSMIFASSIYFSLVHPMVFQLIQISFRTFSGHVSCHKKIQSLSAAAAVEADGHKAIMQFQDSVGLAD